VALAHRKQENYQANKLQEKAFLLMADGQLLMLAYQPMHKPRSWHRWQEAGNCQWT